MGHLEYQAIPSLRNIAHVDGLCTFSNILYQQLQQLGLLGAHS
jgi:hypothetical protein